jgi:hypothetical protein
LELFQGRTIGELNGDLELKLAFVDVKALGEDTKFSFQREQLRRSHAMAQAQLGFHWGLQLWLGFFDSLSLFPSHYA